MTVTLNAERYSVVYAAHLVAFALNHMGIQSSTLKHGVSVKVKEIRHVFDITNIEYRLKGCGNLSPSRRTG